ncbi:MAG: hypothetical protein EA396_11605 [Anaerolineaceae bacterium]|nr:MAG: hypothetical protein EA396_11605 [Anaerolineaceae bacterium]
MLLCLLAPVLLAACDTEEEQTVARIPTATLVPLVTLTPAPTATPVVTNTPLPTFTPIPSDTLTPSPSAIPPTATPTPQITGIVGGGQRINFRAAPAETGEVIGALTPGDGLLILGQNSDGSWLNVRTDDGDEGWVATRLIFIPPTVTPFPSATPTTDLTAVALGTTFPTAVIGGQPVTPTPPPAALSPTPTEAPDDAPTDEPAEPTTDDQTEADEADDDENGVDLSLPPINTPTPDSDSAVTPTAPPTDAAESATEEVFLPVIDVTAIQQTATALAGGTGIDDSAPRQIPLTPPATGQSPNLSAVSASAPTPTPAPTAEIPQTQDNAFVFALCDNPALGGTPPPDDLAVGSGITIWWGWFVSDPIYVSQHESAVIYDVTINGEEIPDWRNYGGEVEPVGNSYIKSWYVPAGILQEAGEYVIEFTATWSRAITDGYDRFGIGTANPTVSGTCTFNVRED